MNNPQTSTVAEQPIGIIQSSYTVSVTFTAKPDEQTRQKLKAAGSLYDKGRWFRNESDSKLGTQSSVDQLLAA
jgi:hypothetical protein